MKVRFFHLCLSVFICVSFFMGCCPKPQPTTKGDFAPTEPMADVVAAINRNNSRLPTLWAEIGRVRAQFTDDNGRPTDETLDGGVLLYRQEPRSVRLVGNKLIVGQVLDLGSNEDVYWLSVKEGPDTAWWGHYENLGKPCSKPLPIRPDLLFEVLGISLFNPDLAALPAPVMRFNHDTGSYMFVWVTQFDDRWVATREVWYDRTHMRPTHVILYDVNGRVTLRAFLGDHKPVEVAGVPREQWPSVASEYDLFFPENKSKLTMRLGTIKLQNRGAPSQASFNFNPDARRLGVSKLIQLDEACGP